MLKRFVLSLLCILWLVPKPVFAAANPGSPGQIFQVTPIILNAPLTLGSPATFSIQVKNLLQTSLGIHAAIEDFRPEGEDDLITAGAHQDPLISWSTIPNPDMVMSPGETKSLTLTILPRKPAKNGNYYELVFLTPFFDQQKAPTSPIVLSRVGVLVSGTIGTPNYSSLKTESIISKLEMLKTKGPNTYALTVHVQNNAAYQFNAKPTLTFTPLFGKPQVFVVQDKHVLPHTTRRFIALATSKSRLLYKLTAVISVGNGVQFTKSSWIWQLPFSPFYIWMAVILIPIVFLLIFARQRLRTAIHILFGKNT